MPQMSPMTWALIVSMLIMTMMLIMSNMSSLFKLAELNKNFIKKSNKMKW